jgi:hypothetical protein
MGLTLAIKALATLTALLACHALDEQLAPNECIARNQDGVCVRESNPRM